MNAYSVSSWHAVRRALLWLLLAVLACVLLLAAAEVASAQCVQNPTGETAVGLQNQSSYYLLFFIDGVRMDGVPSGDRSIYFVVEAGEHVLRAEAVINGETVSAIRKADIPEGKVCTWTVTDPPSKAGESQKEFQDSIRGAPRRDSARLEGQRR
jgi:hypothetical protein